MQDFWFFVSMGSLVWLYPWLVILQVLFAIFIYDKKYFVLNKKNIKFVYRETIGELRYLIPLYNWSLMYNLVVGKVIVEAFLRTKLIKLNGIEERAVDKKKKV